MKKYLQEKKKEEVLLARLPWWLLGSRFTHPKQHPHIASPLLTGTAGQVRQNNIQVLGSPLGSCMTLAR